jgi:hypothetical protein
MKKAQREVILYDANHARAIPVDRLLDALGIRHDKQGHVNCPFPEHHRHGDAHPSRQSLSLVHHLEATVCVQG